MKFYRLFLLPLSVCLFTIGVDSVAEEPWAERQRIAERIKSDDASVRVEGYVPRDVRGWPVRVSTRLLQEQPKQIERALELLDSQLETVQKIVPAAAMPYIQHVPIWFSPPYQGFGQTGEYHPNAQWLRKNGRPTELHQCVEFTNTAIFDREIQRMPVLVLHELAHAYHEQRYGYNDPEIRRAFEAAKESGIYESVQRGSRKKKERAYAITNPMEYFAELSEALMGENDFFPFNRAELKQHDPRAYQLLRRLWEMDSSDEGNHSDEYVVQDPPASMELDPFYTKYVDAHGYPVVASKNVNDYALKEAAYLIDMMLAQRPDVRRAMVASGSRMIVMAHNEFTTDIPEHSKLTPKNYWDARARGLGGSRHEPVCSCGEENLLGYEGDPYFSENILIHEFAHNIHLRGMVNLDPTFDDRLKATYEKAMAAGLWKSKYASQNHAEYFAEGVQSWFDNNRKPDHDHNHVDTRAELKEYDPGLAAICEEVFGKTELVYTKPITRLHGHLQGYDPAKSPKFVWPKRVVESQKQIRNEVKQRGDNRRKEYKN